MKKKNEWFMVVLFVVGSQIMAKGSYLGGSTKLYPGQKVAEAPTKRERFSDLYEVRPRLVFDAPVSTCEDLKEMLGDVDYDTVLEIFEAGQHAFFHGDITAFKLLAIKTEKPGDSTSLWWSNRQLQIANFLMIGRKFDRVDGNIVIVKSARLEWNVEGLNALHEILLGIYDPSVDDAPNFHVSFPL